jgi:hypothetical protein
MLGSLQEYTTHDEYVIYKVYGLTLIITTFKNQPNSWEMIIRDATGWLVQF